MKIKTAILAVIIVAAVGGYFFWKKGKDEKAASDKPAAPTELAIKKGALRVIVESTGRVIPHQELDIKCKASGEITEIPFDVSDEVGQGDLLVQLDPQDEERNVKKAETTLLVSRTRLIQSKIAADIAEKALESEKRKSQAALKYSEAREREAATKFERQGALLSKKMISREEYEASETSLYQARSDLESARSRVADLESQELSVRAKKEDVKISEAQVESDTLALSDARQRLQDTTIVSPIDGIIASRNVQPGQIIASAINNVSGGTSMMMLMDLSRMYVYASVDESEIGNVKIGQEVRIKVDAFPNQVFTGNVARIAARGAESSNVVTFEVRIEITSRNKNMLRPQMTAAVEIIVCDRDDVITVPSNAVNRDRRESFVLVKGGRENERRAVETGVTDGDKIEVISGLSEGDTVIIPSTAAGRWNRTGDSSRNNRMMQMQMMGGGPPMGGGHR